MVVSRLPADPHESAQVDRDPRADAIAESRQNVPKKLRRLFEAEPQPASEEQRTGTRVS